MKFDHVNILDSDQSRVGRISRIIVKIFISSLKKIGDFFVRDWSVKCVLSLYVSGKSSLEFVRFIATGTWKPPRNSDLQDWKSICLTLPEKKIFFRNSIEKNISIPEIYQNLAQIVRTHWPYSSNPFSSVLMSCIRPYIVLRNCISLPILPYYATSHLYACVLLFCSYFFANVYFIQECIILTRFEG